MTEAEKTTKESSEEIERKPVKRADVYIAEKVLGKVKWFNVKSGYGFITVTLDDREEDVFIHGSGIRRNNWNHWNSLAENEEVLLDIKQGVKGKEASNVTGPDGKHVKGSKYAGPKFLYFGRRNYYTGYYAPQRYNYRRQRTQQRRQEPKTEASGEEMGQEREDEKQMKRKKRQYNRRSYPRNRKQNNSEEVEPPKEGEGDAAETNGEKSSPKNSGSGSRSVPRKSEDTNNNQDGQTDQKNHRHSSRKGTSNRRRKTYKNKKEMVADSTVTNGSVLVEAVNVPIAQEISAEA